MTYLAAGMQQLVTAVRLRGATNVLMLSGVNFANDVNEWLAYMPTDPLQNLLASQHFYYKGPCGPEACWDATLAMLARRVPIVAGEVGDTDCNIRNSSQVLKAFEQHHVSYLGWDWGTDFGCQSLIRGYDGTPTQPYGQWFHDWVLRAEGMPVGAHPLTTYFDNVGIVADRQQAACLFDRDNHCFSAQALALGGLPPGSSVPLNQGPFTWNPPIGEPDNVVAAGQTVAIIPALPSATSLNMIGAATSGPVHGTLMLTYTDGMTATASVDVSDWTLTSGGLPEQLERGNTIVAGTPYRDNSDGSFEHVRTYLFGVSIQLDPRRTLAHVRLPVLDQTASAPHLHIFAMSASHA
jgi:hypothetical protein